MRLNSSLAQCKKNVVAKNIRVEKWGTLSNIKAAGKGKTAAETFQWANSSLRKTEL